jgi:hypothetical protein
MPKLRADAIRALEAACELAAELVEGGTLFVIRSDGTARPLKLQAHHKAALQQLTGRSPSRRSPRQRRGTDAERKPIVERIRALTDGLTPHGLYGIESLTRLREHLESDPLFVGPFEGKPSWSAAPVFGKDAVAKHQRSRRRKASQK